MLERHIEALRFRRMAKLLTVAVSRLLKLHLKLLSSWKRMRRLVSTCDVNRIVHN